MYTTTGTEITSTPVKRTAREEDDSVDVFEEIVEEIRIFFDIEETSGLP